MKAINNDGIFCSNLRFAAKSSRSTLGKRS